ncbi:MAG: formyltetrahydrofolate deformylase [Nitriliruptoraceae bacterium]
MTTRHVLTLRCPDRPGIVRALADGVFSSDGNIVDSQQFTDADTGTFFIRMEVDSPLEDAEALDTALRDHLTAFDPDLRVRRSDRRQRVLIMVSRQDHCLVDLLYRWEAGQLPIDIPVVVSNHPDTRPLVERHGIAFVHVPVTGDTRGEAEARLLELVEEHAVDLVVLARYMQILSDDLCTRLEGRIVNIHHSFLPAFRGARPYHQAFERGVKIIGATAHHVTADLDEGPIIEQDVVRVSHATSPEQLTVIGRDIERLVLARAVQLVVEDRVLLNGTRTVVFP